jgi:glutamate transport system permease protein
MTAPVLADALGPRGRRQARIASVVALVVIAVVVVVAIVRLNEKGQFDEAKWRPLTQWPVIRFLLVGLVNTIKVAAVSMAGALAIGALMALARLSKSRVPRLLASVYVEFFRGLPLYLLIAFCAFALPQSGIDINLFWALALGLIVYNSAILAEVYRAGILSLDRGQSEAASAIGMGYWQTMGLVLIPQAIRRMVPAIVSQLVTLIKDTSLGVVIGYEELLRRAQITGEFFDNVLQTLAFAAVIYITINFSLSVVARRLEVRQRRRYQAGSMDVTGVEDLAVVSATATAATATATSGSAV